MTERGLAQLGLGQQEVVACPVAVAGVPPFQVLVGQDELKGTTPYGLVDPVSQALAGANHVHNLPLLELMLRLSKPGELVVDIGAHVGLFTLTAAAAGRRVLSIEASRRNHALLSRSVALNGFDDRVELVNAAASDQPGELSFWEAGPFGQVVDGNLPGGSRIPALRVGDLLTGRAETVGLIKIDIEGFEVEALKGMADWLDRGDVTPAILYESHLTAHQKRGRSIHTLRDVLVQLGYRHHYSVLGLGRLASLELDGAQPEIVAECLAVKRPLQVPPGWKVKPFVWAGFCAALLATSRDFWDQPEFLVALARELGDPSTHCPRHPRILLHLQRLSRHPDHAVRQAFAPWSNPGMPLLLGVEQFRERLVGLGKSVLRRWRRCS